jgi:outer membrane lipoprotein-sorting protein
MDFDENTFARMIDRAGGDDSPRPEHQRQLRGRLLEVFDLAPAETVHPTFLTRSLANWRWIMRSPISRAAAAAIFVFAILGVVLWFHTAGATPAFADFIQPILDAKTVKFKMTAETEGQPPLISEGMALIPYRMRDESRQTLSGGLEMRQVTITDYQKGKVLRLDPERKTAFVTTYTNMPKDMASKSWFATVRSLLSVARDKPEVKREPLGEKKIDGHTVIGYRLSGRGLSNIPGLVMSLWGDPQTGLPVRAEISMWNSGKETKLTMSDFVFNVDLDESLFSVEPPAGYTTKQQEVDLSPPEEKDLIETLRRYSQQGGGVFPDALDLREAFNFVGKAEMAELKKHDIVWRGASKDSSEQHKQEIKEANKEAERRVKELFDARMKITRGLMFVLKLSPDADAHYAGKGIQYGAAGKPIFWYRPKDAKKYRVIYADLSVRDADMPPVVPNAQPVPAQPKP